MSGAAPRPIYFTKRVRRGLGSLRRLLREESVFAAVFVGNQAAKQRKEITLALDWIKQEETRPVKARKKTAGVSP